MGDRGDGGVVLVGIHLPRLCPDCARDTFDPLDGRCVGGPGDDHPRPSLEQIRLGCAVPRALTTGHRVSADESQTVLAGPCDDRGLRAGDVGDHGVRAERRAPRTGESVELVEADGRRAGQDDEIRVSDGGLGTCDGLVDHAVTGGSGRPLAGR
jgi:hypothetical protein